MRSRICARRAALPNENVNHIDTGHHLKVVIFIDHFGHLYNEMTGRLGLPYLDIDGGQC